MAHAQRALLGTIDEGLSAVSDAQNQLGQRAQLPDLGDDAVSSVMSCVVVHEPDHFSIPKGGTNPVMFLAHLCPSISIYGTLVLLWQKNSIPFSAPFWDQMPHLGALAHGLVNIVAISHLSN